MQRLPIRYTSRHASALTEFERRISKCGLRQFLGDNAQHEIAMAITITISNLTSGEQFCTRTPFPLERVATQDGALLARMMIRAVDVLYDMRRAAMPGVSFGLAIDVWSATLDHIDGWMMRISYDELGATSPAMLKKDFAKCPAGQSLFNWFEQIELYNNAPWRTNR